MGLKVNRRLPSKREIEDKAKQGYFERAFLSGLPTITPTRKELSEGGLLTQARASLMRRGSEEQMQQRKYVDTVASELGLRVIPKKELRVLKKRTGVSYTNGWSIPKKKKPRKAEPVGAVKTTKKPKRKKRRIQRAGITMRKLRKPMKDGKKVFAFPDNVWKVKKK